MDHEHEEPKTASHRAPQPVGRRDAEEAYGERGNTPAAGFAAKAAVVACGTLVVLATVLVSPGVPAMRQHFGDAGETLVKLVVTAPALAIMLLSPVGGWLCDRVGRRPVLLAGLAGFAVFGSAGWWTPEIWSLLASRVLLGASTGAILIATGTLIGDYAEGEERQTWLGFQVAAVSVVSAGTTLLAAWLVGGGQGLISGGGGGDWRSPFALYLLGLPLLPLAWWAVVEPPRERDTGGAWSNVPWAKVLPVCGVAFGLLVIYNLATTQVPTYLSDDLDRDSPMWTAGLLAVISLVGIPSALYYRRLRERFDIGPILISVLVTGAAGFAVAGAWQSLAGLLVGVFVYSVLYGTQTPAVQDWTLSTSGGSVRGKVMGLLNAATFAGSFASPLISQPLADAYGVPAVFGIAAGLQVLFAVGFVIAICVRRTGEAGGRGRAGEAATA